MGLHEGFAEVGVLSTGITNGAAHFRAENADWFKLAEDTNAALMRTASLGPMLVQYLNYQRLSDDAAHVSALSLHRHVDANADRSGWRYKWGAGNQGENSATLHRAILATLPIGIAITQLLKDSMGNAAFLGLADRFKSMPPVPSV